MAYPQSISQILPKVMSKLGLSQKVKEMEVVRDWPKIVGEEVAKHAQPVTLERGCLTVHVDSSPWLTELERYAKQSIYEKIKDRLGAKIVNRIRFKIGEIK